MGGVAASVRDDAGWQVKHGDAYDLLQQLPAASIDLILTSPPSIVENERLNIFESHEIAAGREQVDEVA